MYTATLNGQDFPFVTGKCVCVGRNYREHAKELNNPIPSSPLLFIKPADAVVAVDEFELPTQWGSVHHELELALLIGSKLKQASPEEAQKAIVGVGLALDLTLRDVQSKLKEKGQPWEIAKAFDGACPVSEFYPAQEFDLTDTHFSLTRNGQLQQQGHSAEMIFPALELVSYMSRIFTLNPGDIILTGTPAGVGPLESGDRLVLQLAHKPSIQSNVA